MIDDPGDPLGNGPQEIWARKLMRFLRRHLVTDITNAKKKPQATGGVIYEVMPQIPPSAGKAGLRFASPMLYDHTKSYAFQEKVYVAPTDLMVTVGTTDPDSSQKVFAIAGWWEAVQAVAPVTNPAYAADHTQPPLLFHIPQLPWPTPGLPDDPLNYWILVTPDNACLIPN
jgi:hypothetical protein